MPCRIAPAWPLMPPPCTRTRRSYRAVRVGDLERRERERAVVARGKYSSSERPLIHVLPSPGRRITRATDVLRLPVPRYWAIRPSSSSVFGACAACGCSGPAYTLSLRELRGREPVLGEHALHRLADDLGRTTLELLAERPLLEPARVAGVRAHHLLVELLAGDLDLLRVDDDHEVARVDVRGVLGLALSPQRVGDLASRAGPGSCPRRRRRTSRAGSRPAWRCRWSSLGKRAVAGPPAAECSSALHAFGRRPGPNGDKGMPRRVLDVIMTVTLGSQKRSGASRRSSSACSRASEWS